MASGKISLYTELGDLVIGAVYLSPSHRRDLLDIWVRRYRRRIKGSYTIISPTAHPDNVKENGKNWNSGQPGSSDPQPRMTIDRNAI